MEYEDYKDVIEESFTTKKSKSCFEELNGRNSDNSKDCVGSISVSSKYESIYDLGDRSYTSLIEESYDLMISSAITS